MAPQGRRHVLLTGPAGIGKTTRARVVAEHMVEAGAVREAATLDLFAVHTAQELQAALAGLASVHAVRVRGAGGVRPLQPLPWAPCLGRRGARGPRLCVLCI